MAKLLVKERKLGRNSITNHSKIRNWWNTENKTSNGKWLTSEQVTSNQIGKKGSSINLVWEAEQINEHRKETRLSSPLCLINTNKKHDQPPNFPFDLHINYHKDKWTKGSHSTGFRMLGFSDKYIHPPDSTSLLTINKDGQENGIETSMQNLCMTMDFPLFVSCSNSEPN